MSLFSALVFVGGIFLIRGALSALNRALQRKPKTPQLHLETKPPTQEEQALAQDPQTSGDTLRELSDRLDAKILSRNPDNKTYGRPYLYQRCGGPFFATQEERLLKETLLRNPNVPMELCLEFAQAFPEAFLGNPCLPLWRLSALGDELLEITVLDCQLMLPDCSNEIFEVLAQQAQGGEKENEELYIAAIEHPNAPTDLAERFARSPSPAAQYAVAGSSLTSMALLIELSEHGSDYLKPWTGIIRMGPGSAKGSAKTEARRTLARHPKTTRELLQQLALDGDSFVRSDATNRLAGRA